MVHGKIFTWRKTREKLSKTGVPSASSKRLAMTGGESYYINIPKELMREPGWKDKEARTLYENLWQ
jgi:hypothetical protein